MSSRRDRKRPKKKRRFLRKVFLLCVILLLAAVGYGVAQYYQGKSEASDGQYTNDGNNFPDFHGEEPIGGEIKTLLLGSDARGGGDHGRSDTLMIGYYNKHTNETKLVSIMRDTYVNIPGHGMQKINAAFSLGGPELLRKTIKENFGVDINYYAVVDFAGFPKLIDLLAPNGITVDIPEKMSYGIGMTLQPGTQTLHGDKLLGYVRFRHNAESDFGRIKRQQEVLGKVKEQAMRPKSIIKLPKLLGMIDPYVETNVSNGTMLSIAKGMVTGSTKNMETLRIPVEGSYTNERTSVGLVLNPNLEQNKQALQAFLSGKK